MTEKQHNLRAKRTALFIRPDCRRVLLRPFAFRQEERIVKIVARIQSMTEQEVEAELDTILLEFRERHQHIQNFFLKRFQDVRSFLLTDEPLSEARQMLVGAYFTQEYSLESAALFNPSMVWHPDQSNLPEGSRRFIISLRATGEGHISSITFRSGIIDAQHRIVLDPASRYVTAAETVVNATYDKQLFERKLYELGLLNEYAQHILSQLGTSFTLPELQHVLRSNMRPHRLRHSEPEMTARGMLALARSNYEIEYDPKDSLSERIIFPHAPSERNGIEDARFVQFVDDDGSVIYYATYTAFDGHVIFPQLLETRDFLRFRISTLNGPEVKNKGMALFPRKINGHYAMLSRQDNENLYLMYSDHIHFWYHKEIVARPTYAWEFIQIGNCGSPIETEAGWLVLTHGVGPMRKYAIGAMLLDLNDPVRVIGRLSEPLLSPNENEREGYVPNVVYSCGGVIHGDELIIPYAMSDYASSFATVNLDELLSAMRVI